MEHGSVVPEVVIYALLGAFLGAFLSGVMRRWGIKK